MKAVRGIGRKTAFIFSVVSTADAARKRSPGSGAKVSRIDREVGGEWGKDEIGSQHLMNTFPPSKRASWLAVPCRLCVGGKTTGVKTREITLALTRGLQGRAIGHLALVGSIRSERCDN